MEVSGELHASAAILSEKEPTIYLLDKRPGRPQSQSVRYGEVKILYPTGTRTPTPRSVSPAFLFEKHKNQMEAA
jgi:hypothetical protein